MLGQDESTNAVREGVGAVPAEVRKCIGAATDYLLSRQRPDGHWVGEAEGDTILESEYILLMTILRNGDRSKLLKAAEYIRRKQLPEGGWAIYEGGCPDLSASVKGYFALKLAGTDPGESHMALARKRILEMGGAGLCNSYTKFYLAALGQIGWDDAPAVPPELMLLPDWFYLNIYEISSWSRTFVVPLSIIWAHRPTAILPKEIGISEIFVPSKSGYENIGTLTWKRAFLWMDAAIKSFERRGIHPRRREALTQAKEWMFARFERSAGMGAIFPPMIYALIALRCLGYSDDDPQVVRARAALEALEIEEGDTLRLQPCTSPVWDTAIAMNALTSAGLPPDDPRLVRSAEWMVSKEVRHPGDWSRKRPELEPSGWYFEYENEFYPDIDDTAMVLLALKGVDTSAVPGASDAIRRGLNWILGMQGKDGGWASFDVDNNKKLFCSVPFADHNAMIDPSTADITARILEMLAAYGYDESHPQVRKAIRYVLREQESDGSWFGRWGVNYIYGTWQALKGLWAMGFTPDHPSVRRAARWLISFQNDDGGWGESCKTYDCPAERGMGRSTASQTAWALMGLMVSGRADSEAVRRGVEYLVRTQNSEGSWDEQEWTGTGFPRVFYLRYHLYRHTFPLWALGMYDGYMQTGRIALPANSPRRAA